MKAYNNKEYPLGSINTDSHPQYAFKKAREVAENILLDEKATSNERALADCVIVLIRSVNGSMGDRKLTCW